MTASVLPTSPASFAKATWADIIPYYDELAERPVDSDTVDEWLRTWSTLEELVTEAAARAMIEYSIDTADPQKESDHLRFSSEILPRMEERTVGLARRLIESGLRRPDMATTLRRFETAIALFREANVPIFAEAEQLAARYQRITGSMTAMWEGEERPLPQLQPYLKSAERPARERAWHVITAPYLAARDTLAELFDRMYALRQQAAHNAGFANFRDYIFPAKFRFDYGPADCERLHGAIESTVVPAVERLFEQRRHRLGIAEIRPWDLQVDPWRAAPLKPFETVDELVAGARRVFGRVSPDLGGEFQTMIDLGLLDLASRRGKAPGGYCETLQYQGRPFIFMNAVGIAEDVNTLLHEAGHAFHAFAARAQPFIWQRQPGAEAAELASMSMELIAARHLVRPTGYFTPDEARSARLEHLEDVLISLAHIASVDAFQHWIYASGQGHDAAARDEAWLRIRARFERGIDWSGLETERIARWYRQLHIFLHPFYYIEYAIAEIGALQVWRNSLRDPTSAVAHYRRALSLGSTRPLPSLYQAAGVELSFDAKLLGDLVALVEEHIEELRGAVATPDAPAA
ncbi:MAG TPA: M3 family oligoendopeptidase [Gemmatimonadales bacterium]|nr:M3 family oligoendopeptidase [Gemmatimonadales bacterium]